MKLRELITHLHRMATDLGRDDFEVIVSSDAEGNNYHGLDSVESMLVVKQSYGYDVYDPAERDRPLEGLDAAIVIYPTD